MSGEPSKRVIRIDAGALRSPMDTPQGFLRVDGYAGRCGIYEYMNDDGTIRRELRTPEELFRQAALDGFEGAPVTDGHPTEPVTRDNVTRYEVGTSTAARRDGDNVATSMVIKRGDTIAKVKSGRGVQLSPGYALDLDMKSGKDSRYGYPGNPEGRYDAVQRNIEINHLALVDQARGGPSMKLRLDEKEHTVTAYRMDGHSVATIANDEELSAEQRNKLRDSQFAYPEAGKLPINDRTHIVAAMGGHGLGATDFGEHPGAKKRAFHKIVAAAKAHGIDTEGFEKAHGGHLDNDGPMPEGGYDSDNYDKRGSMSTKDNPVMTNTDALKALEAQRINLDADVRRLTEENASLKLRADTAEGKLAEVEKNTNVLRAELQAAKMASETAAVQRERTRADAAEASLETLRKTRAQEVRDRVKLERACAPSLGDGFRMDTLSDRDLMCATLKRLDAHADVSTAVPDGVIIGRFQAAVERRDENARSLATVSTVMDTTKHEDARAKADRESRNAWKAELPNAKYKNG